MVMPRWCALVLIVGVLLIGRPAHAGTVNLQLNDIGVSGLEAALDVARKNGSMHDADMAVSLWNALQQAKMQSMQADAAQQQANQAKLKELQGKIDDLQKQLDDKDKP